MTGVYTDNQPDFTWLKPFEEKTFKQYFMPYKKVGAVKNATIHAVLNMEDADREVSLTVYATEKYENAEAVLSQCGREVFREKITVSPADIYERKIPVEEHKTGDIRAAVYFGDKVLVEYQPEEPGILEMAKPAEAAKDPEEIRTNEELFLTGQHIEQYRHATYLPDPYYLEGLKRDPRDIRINNAYGLLLFRRGCFCKAEEHFRRAIRRLTWKNPNPYDSEAYYNLGLALFYQRKKDEAFDAFYKATWSSEQQEMSFYYLSAIEAERAHYEEALEFVEKGLVKNIHNVKARGLKAILLRKLGRLEEAKEWIAENLKVDPFDYVSWFELTTLEPDNREACDKRKELMRDHHENYLLTARDYAEAGCMKEAVAVLEMCTNKTPMPAYYKAYYLWKMGEEEAAYRCCREADQCSPYCCFPNKLEDIAVLECAADLYPEGGRSYYYLGNLYYDKLQFERATELWEQSVKQDDGYPTVHRNLALAYYNKKRDPAAAIIELEKAFSLDDTDARVFLELDQLRKKTGWDFASRLQEYDRHSDLIRQRDDLMIEYVTLLNQVGRYKDAYQEIMGHTFRPWEGAEGRITTQYKTALTEMAKESVYGGRLAEAENLLERALIYPENLGEGRLEGTKDNHIYYYLGIVRKKSGRRDDAQKAFAMAELGLGNKTRAADHFQRSLEHDPNHQNSRIYLKMAETPQEAVSILME